VITLDAYAHDVLGMQAADLRRLADTATERRRRTGAEPV
jgi:hypothetical protein